MLPRGPRYKQNSASRGILGWDNSCVFLPHPSLWHEEFLHACNSTAKRELHNSHLFTEYLVHCLFLYCFTSCSFFVSFHKGWWEWCRVFWGVLPFQMTRKTTIHMTSVLVFACNVSCSRILGPVSRRLVHAAWHLLFPRGCAWWYAGLLPHEDIAETMVKNTLKQQGCRLTDHDPV